jgi:hypothetical protein
MAYALFLPTSLLLLLPPLTPPSSYSSCSFRVLNFNAPELSSRLVLHCDGVHGDDNLEEAEDEFPDGECWCTPVELVEGTCGCEAGAWPS